MKLEAIIKGCKKNDRQAQAELFSTYKDSLYFLALKYCKSKSDAEDVLHDAFMVIFNRINTYNGSGSFIGWMKRIVIYKAIDRYKKAKAVSTATLENLPEETKVDANLSVPLDVLLECIQQLPDQYRLVFNLYQLDGYSHKEVANMLHISENTSKSNYHRAKQQLRKMVGALKTELNLKTE